MVDRVINYVGAVPLDVDLLNTNKNLMIGLGFALQAILGGSTVVDGLACTPTGPASQQVLVAQGSIYSTENVEGTAFGSLGSDTAHQILKQGITALGNTAFTCAAPSTSGQSIAYLIQGEYQDIDGGSTVLPYYNASNPAVAFNGPANSGTSQNTVRQGKLVLNLKAGASATTGTQVTPTPDAGFTGLWVVTVANGITAITSGMIALYPGAPFINYKLPQLSPAGPLARTALSGNTTYYVSNAGSDSTGTGTTGNPWATFQHAYNQLQGIDCAGFSVTIQFQGSGPYTSNTTCNIAPVPANTPVIFDGASQTVSTTSADCFTVIGDGLNVKLQNVKLQTTTSGNGVTCGDGGRVTIGAGVNFGAVAQQHISGNSSAVYNCPNAYTISGSAVNHWAVDLNSIITANGITVTLTGTPAFTTFASTEEVSSIQAIGNTYSGAATGVQYISQLNGTINTNGAPTNWPTGLTSGSVLTGGQIV
jgi:hypothetical protein